MEINGLVFTKVDNKYLVEDINYMCVIGVLICHEVLGWILYDIKTTFLDYGQLATIAEFMKGLPTP